MKAFPQAQFRGNEPVDTAEHGGMDLRDHFAGLAMQGTLANGVEMIFTKRAEIAYKIADAMMEARK